MNQKSSDPAVTTVTEVIGRLTERDAFAGPVHAPLDARFTRADLSVPETLGTEDVPVHIRRQP